MEQSIDSSEFSARKVIRTIERNNATRLNPEGLRKDIFLAIRTLLGSKEVDRTIIDASYILKDWCRSYHYQQHPSTLTDLIIAEDRTMNDYEQIHE